MKVLMINGSARRKGNTYLALCEIAKTLELQGVESEIIQTGTKAVRGCIACNQCKMKQLNSCVFNDDICNIVVEKLANADALIVGSPTYYGQPMAQSYHSSNVYSTQIRWERRTNQLPLLPFAAVEEVPQSFRH